jgi:hypothetical protein
MSMKPKSSRPCQSSLHIRQLHKHRPTRRYLLVRKQVERRDGQQKVLKQRLHVVRLLLQPAVEAGRPPAQQVEQSSDPQSMLTSNTVKA